MDLHAYASVPRARAHIGGYFAFYNAVPPHSAPGRSTRYTSTSRFLQRHDQSADVHSFRQRACAGKPSQLFWGRVTGKSFIGRCKGGKYISVWPFNVRPLVRPPLRVQWRAGDVAECVCDDWNAASLKAPRRGGRFIVIDVQPGRSGDLQLGWCLQLIGYSGRWDATAFRMVLPIH